METIPTRQHHSYRGAMRETVRLTLGLAAVLIAGALIMRALGYDTDSPAAGLVVGLAGLVVGAIGFGATLISVGTVAVAVAVVVLAVGRQVAWQSLPIVLVVLVCALALRYGALLAIWWVGAGRG